ncbi:MAG: hypothetical protein IPI76_17445 [Chloracidobacterium sp.]|nr:hypothetical protein [Chloracidobacterium sp.]
MKSKKSESSTIAPQQSTINTELYRIYDEIAEPTGDQLVNQGIISSITDAARALIAERLGNDGIPAIASRLNSGQVANNLIHAITKILDNYDVRCEDALGIFPFLFEQIGNYGPEPRDNHLEELFELRVYSWFRRKVEEETSSLEPPDRLAEVEKRFYRVRNSTTEISHACYYAVLLDIKIDLEVEIAIDSKRIENASHLKLRNEPRKLGAEKVVKTRRKIFQRIWSVCSSYYLFRGHSFDRD